MPKFRISRNTISACKTVSCATVHSLRWKFIPFGQITLSKGNFLRKELEIPPGENRFIPWKGIFYPSETVLSRGRVILDGNVVHMLSGPHILSVTSSLPHPARTELCSYPTPWFNHAIKQSVEPGYSSAALEPGAVCLAWASCGRPEKTGSVTDEVYQLGYSVSILLSSVQKQSCKSIILNKSCT